MTMTLVGSGDEFSLLRQCAQRCVDNSGDWYGPRQAAAILGEHVGEPALLADAAFIGMATPECILRLLDKAESAHLSRPTQAVDVEAIREVIAYLEIGHRFDVEVADKLTRAIGNAQAEGRKVPEGCIPVPRSLVERWATVDAFNAPVGAAMELKTVAAQMLIHADMIPAPPQPEE